MRLQLVTFIGMGPDLLAAVEDAQTQANIWLKHLGAHAATSPTIRVQTLAIQRAQEAQFYHIITLLIGS